MSSESSNPLSEVSPWNLVSGGYSSMAELIMTPFSLKAMECIDLHPEAKVLDVACGTGTLSIPLSKKVGLVRAVDFSKDMLCILSEKIEREKIRNISVDCCDGQNLFFENDFFEFAFSMFGLMFFPDRLRGFKELYRVLKSGGLAVVSSWAPIEKSSLMLLLFDTLKVSYPELASLRKNSSTLENPEDFENEMRQASFKNINIHETQICIPPMNPDLFWKIMSEGVAPLLVLRRKVGGEKWKQVHQSALQYLRKRVGEDGVELFTTAYIGVGEKA